MKSTYKHFNNLQTIILPDTLIKTGLTIYVRVFNKMVQSISPTAEELPAGHASVASSGHPLNFETKNITEEREETRMGTQYCAEPPPPPSSI